MAHQRYVFYFAMGTCTQAAIRAAQMTVSALGVTVIKAGTGTLLVETTPAKAAEMAKVLPQWSSTREKRTTQLPESAALQRTRLKRAGNTSKD